jgi:sulfate adenylyltransferase subunit 1 (EFTu-like GTPase family)
VDVSRGDLIVGAEGPPAVGNALRATVCWMSSRPLAPRATLAIKHTTRWARAQVTALESRLDVTTLAAQPSPARLELNDIATVALKTTAPLAFDPYTQNRVTGSFILVDEASNATVGAGMIQGALEG